MFTVRPRGHHRSPRMPYPHLRPPSLRGMPITQTTQIASKMLLDELSNVMASVGHPLHPEPHGRDCTYIPWRCRVRVLGGGGVPRDMTAAEDYAESLEDEYFCHLLSFSTPYFASLHADISLIDFAHRVSTDRGTASRFLFSWGGAGGEGGGSAERTKKRPAVFLRRPTMLATTIHRHMAMTSVPWPVLRPDIDGVCCAPLNRAGRKGVGHTAYGSLGMYNCQQRQQRPANNANNAPHPPSVLTYPDPRPRPLSPLFAVHGDDGSQPAAAAVPAGHPG